MKIKDGLKLNHDRIGRVVIPDCSRNDLPEFFAEMGFKKGVEIGVARGGFTKKFCEAGIEMVGVDPWMADDNYDYEPGQKAMDDMYEQAKEAVKDYPNCKLLRMTSLEAAELFEDNTFDFVYIDGHHGFRHVVDDINEWSKKVRKGGVISGHDYATTVGRSPHDPMAMHAMYAVDAYVKAYRIWRFYVLGRKDKIKGEKRDAFRSWMWFNDYYKD
jgi:hypothetical protein